MTALQSLEELRHLEKELNALKEYRYRLSGSMTAVSSYASTGTQHDRMRSYEAENRRLDRYTETGRRIDAIIEKIDRQHAQILEIIAEVEDSQARTILLMRYLEGITAESIADQLNYSRSQIFRLLKNAVKMYEEAYNKHMTCTEVTA